MLLTERQEAYVNNNLHHSNRVLAAALGVKASYIGHYLLKSGIRKRELHLTKPKKKKDFEVLTEQQQLKNNPCPRHGRDYLVSEGSAVFCHAETPGEIIDHCFYHVSRGRS